MNKSYHHRVESLNIWTHGLGVLFFLFASICLIKQASQSTHLFSITSAIIFSLSLVVLYSASTLYHWARLKFHPKTDAFRLFDHIAIYYLIAGSYTPFTLITLVDGSGWRIFFSVWAIALIGTVYKIWLRKRLPFLSLILYITMGWLIIFDIQELVASTSPLTLYLIAGGGLSYTIGTFFYVKNSIPYNHPIWHLFVLGGSILHFIAVFTVL